MKLNYTCRYFFKEQQHYKAQSIAQGCFFCASSLSINNEIKQMAAYTYTVFYTLIADILSHDNHKIL